MKYLLLLITSLFIQVTTSGALKASVVQDNLDKQSSQNTDVHLPKNINPVSYIIRVTPQFDNDTFIGKNKMKLHVIIATNRIVFHIGKNINLTSRAITNSQKGAMLITSWFYYEETEKYELFVNDTIPAKSVIDLIVDYSGTFSQDTKGIYTTDYWRYSNMFMANETLLHLLGTHFQPTYARYAFPCFDEPHYKAAFTIIIQRPKSFSSFCNLPFTDSLMNNDAASDIYETEVPISTYQISFFIFNFICSYNRQSTIRVCTRFQNSTDLLLALQVGEKARSFFSSFFNEDSPLSPVTMIGIPDQNPEITRSFNLLTFNENRLFYDSILTPDIDYNKIITTIMYGWASISFGQKITLEKWDYAWIHEGIATYLSYYAACKTELNLNSEQQLIIDQMHPAFLEDGTGVSKPLTRTIKTLRDTKLTEDTIIVSKGCSIVRMMHLILGADLFKSAWTNFIKLRTNKISTLSDFWFSFQKSINNYPLELPVNLKTIMNSWTNQPGYPVLHVHVKNGKVELRQQKFSYFKVHSISEKIGWWIPLTWVSSRNPNFETIVPYRWFYKMKEEINLNINQSDWVIFNVQQKGFYRVNYDLQTWSRIIGQLTESTENIPPITRSMIIDDLFNLARADIIPYDVTLEGISYISQEKEYLPIKTALTGLQYLYERFADEEYSILFNNFFLRLILPIYENLPDFDTSKNFSSIDFLRTEIDEWVCKLGYRKCHIAMLDYFYKWREDSKYVIPKNKKSLVHCIAMKYGYLAEIINLYFGVNNSIEQNKVREVFKCISDKSLLTSLFESAINDEKFFFTTKQQSLSAFKAVARSNNENAGFILEFIALHTAETLNYFQDQLIIADIIHTASKVISTPNNFYKLQSFIEKNYTYFDEISEYFEEILTYTMFDIKFYEQNHQAILNWINEYKFLLWVPQWDYTKTTFRRIQHNLRLARNKPEYLINNLEMIQDAFPSSYYFAKEALNFIQYFDDKFSGRYISESFRNYVSKMIIPVFNKSKFEEIPNENLDAKLLRIEIIKWACLLENADCKKKSRELFNNWKTNPSATLPVHLRRIILCTVVKEGDDNDWQYLWNKYRKANFLSERDAIQQALGCTQNRQQLDLLLRFAVTHDIDKERSLEIFSLVSSSGLNGMEQIFDFLFANHVAVNNHFNNDSVIDNLFKDLSNRVTTRKLLQKYQKCVNLYIQMHPKIVLSLAKYIRKAITELSQFDNISLQVFKWICRTYPGNIPLPKNIAPTRYDIRLIASLDPTIFYFDGTVNIILNISCDTSYIVLHVGNLKISSVEIYFKNDLTIIPFNNVLLKYDRLCIVALNKIVEAGTQLLVFIVYKGLFNNVPNIFYRSYYIGQEGLRHLFAATQVEKYGARELFPCFDEMHFKAEFQLSIKKPNSHYSYTNMIFNSSESYFFEFNTWDHYKVTKPMSPNNISIIITDMELKDYGTGLKVWLRSHFVSKKNNYFTNISKIQPKNDAGWLIVNSEQTGFYYVNFNVMTWETLFKNLKQNNFGWISVDNRAQIIDDLYNLAKQNYISLSLFLTGTEYLSNEKDLLPWAVFLKSFHYLWNTFDDPEINDGLKIYLSQLMKPTYQYLGFESKSNDTQQIKNLRGLFLSWIIYLNYTDLTDNSITVFNEWRTNSDYSSLDNILHPFENICNALLNLGFDEWKYVWQYASTIQHNLHKIILVRALACTNNETALSIYLSHIFSTGNWMNNALKKVALASINNNQRNGFDTTLKFLIRSCTKGTLSWSVFNFLLPQMIKYPLSASQLPKFLLFIDDNKAKIGDLNRNIYETLIDLIELTRWYNRSAANLKLWLINKKFITNFNTSINISMSKIP